MTYAVMLLHELAHMAAALCIGLKISHISFYPFGVNLKLSNKMIYSLADEIILYIAGPLCNVMLALVALMLYSRYPCEALRLLYVSNILLFVMNMLPVSPLDGGIILKKILSHIFGNTTATVIIRIVSAVISIAMLFLGFYVLYVTGFNFSIIIFSLLMLGNVFTQREKYDADLIKKIIFTPKKQKITHILLPNSTENHKIIKKFDKKGYNIVYLTDENGKITDILTETQIINKLTRQ